jgi:hypothetical protein
MTCNDSNCVPGYGDIEFKIWVVWENKI